MVVFHLPAGEVCFAIVDKNEKRGRGFHRLMPTETSRSFTMSLVALIAKWCKEVVCGRLELFAHPATRGRIIC